MKFQGRVQHVGRSLTPTSSEPPAQQLKHFAYGWDRPHQQKEIQSRFETESIL